MAELEQQIKRIQDKLQQLLRQKNALLKENEELKQHLDDSKKSVASQQAAIDELKQQAHVLKMNAADMSTTDKKEFEKRLNLYIKEIDRCIAMLSS
jgi:predicted  nucleic acid-binding Zn-ribbon protein